MPLTGCYHASRVAYWSAAIAENIQTAGFIVSVLGMNSTSLPDRISQLSFHILSQNQVLFGGGLIVLGSMNILLQPERRVYSWVRSIAAYFYNQTCGVSISSNDAFYHQMASSLSLRKQLSVIASYHVRCVLDELQAAINSDPNGRRELLSLSLREAVPLLEQHRKLIKIFWIIYVANRHGGLMERLSMIGMHLLESQNAMELREPLMRVTREIIDSQEFCIFLEKRLPFDQLLPIISSQYLSRELRAYETMICNQPSLLDSPEKKGNLLPLICLLKQMRETKEDLRNCWIVYIKEAHPLLLQQLETVGSSILDDQRNIALKQQLQGMTREFLNYQFMQYEMLMEHDPRITLQQLVSVVLDPSNHPCPEDAAPDQWLFLLNSLEEESQACDGKLLDDLHVVFLENKVVLKNIPLGICILDESIHRFVCTTLKTVRPDAFCRAGFI